MKKITLNLFIVVIASCFAAFTHAQIRPAKSEDIEKVKTRGLIVLLKEPSNDVLNKIKKIYNPEAPNPSNDVLKKVKNIANSTATSSPEKYQSKVDEYYANIRTCNSNIKEVIEAFWPYNKNDIQYKTWSEIDTLRKTGNKNYIVIGCTSLWKNGEDFYLMSKSTYYDNDFTTLKIVPIEDDFYEAPITQFILNDDFPTKTSLVAAIKYFERFFDYSIRRKSEDVKEAMKNSNMLVDQEFISRRIKKLPQKTLLIPDDIINDNITESSIKEVYPYDFKICKRDSIDIAVINRDDKYAYLVLAPLPLGPDVASYLQFVIDCADSHTICGTKIGTSFLGYSIGSFKKLSKYIAKSIQRDSPRIVGQE